MDGKALDGHGRLVSIDLDGTSIAPSSREVEHERQIAIHDLLEENLFEPVGHPAGEYALKLSIVDRRLVFVIAGPGAGDTVTHILSLTPFRRVMQDYLLICDSYYQAIRSASPSRIEAIDMGRRGLHNEGSRLLMERLEGKITLDSDTARRLFTLICVLHWKG